MKPLIQVQNIHKFYKMGDHTVEVLKGVSLTIERGDFVAIMGPSGSGKSTLMHILGLLDIPSSGSYELHGQEIAHLADDDLALVRRDTIGFIFQQFNLLPRLQAWQNVSLPLTYSAQGFDRAKGSALLSAVGLGDRIEHKTNELSGGQQQRVAIARALINNPQIILADEPTGNLDSKSEKEIMQILRELNSRGITVIIVTHEEEIGSQASRLIRLRDGVIQSDVRKTPIAGVQIVTEKKAKAPQGFFAEFLTHLQQGFRTIAANKVRSGLSMLGILIGVAAVVGMLALGTGAQQSIQNQLASLGSNLLILRAGGVRVAGVKQETGTRLRLSLEDAQALKDQVSGVKELSPSLTGRAQVTYLSKNWNTSVVAVTPAYEKMRTLQPTYGRFFSDEENKKRSLVALIGTTVTKELFGDKSPIGEMIKINRINFRVIGVLPAKGVSGPQDNDDRIIIPVMTGMYRVFGKDYVESIEVEGQSAAVLGQVQESMIEIMNKRHRVPVSSQDEAFQIFNMADLQTALNQSSKTMSMLLASIATISLIVGGIGIMNIMLVSVTERTREIGLRKAIGARRKDILLQFLAESIVVSVTGGLLGIALGWTVSVGLSAALGWSTYVSLNSVVLSFGFSACIGLVFGIYPAQKAAQLHPIEALRHE